MTKLSRLHNLNLEVHMFRIASLIFSLFVCVCAPPHAAGWGNVLVRGGEVMGHLDSGISGYGDAANGREIAATPEVLVSGAATTGVVGYSVVTAAVGGPVVMGGILVGGSMALSYGVYKGGQAIWRWFAGSGEDQ